MQSAGLNPDNVSVAEMERFVARFQNLHGSEEAFVDSKLAEQGVSRDATGQLHGLATSPD